MFTRAITRVPATSMIDGLSTANLGKPDYALALQQHAGYCEALRACGLVVECLAPEEDLPDSTFVEDAALLTSACAILTRPGAPSRRAETSRLAPALVAHFETLSSLSSPATLDAGDVMMVGRHFYVGLSSRTNQLGVEQLGALLADFEMTVEAVALGEVLHLKTAVSYLENNVLLASKDMIDAPALAKFDRVLVPEQEAYAANSVWINDRVLVPAGNPQSSTLIAERGYEVIELEVSEFRKLDGGLSCLSLRF